MCPASPPARNPPLPYRFLTTPARLRLPAAAVIPPPGGAGAVGGGVGRRPHQLTGAAGRWRSGDGCGRKLAHNLLSVPTQCCSYGAPGPTRACFPRQRHETSTSVEPCARIWVHAFRTSGTKACVRYQLFTPRNVRLTVWILRLCPSPTALHPCCVPQAPRHQH